jgi:hypothetical protein
VIRESEWSNRSLIRSRQMGCPDRAERPDRLPPNRVICAHVWPMDRRSACEPSRRSAATSASRHGYVPWSTLADGLHPISADMGGLALERLVSAAPNRT